MLVDISLFKKTIFSFAIWSFLGLIGATAALAQCTNDTEAPTFDESQYQVDGYDFWFYDCASETVDFETAFDIEAADFIANVFPNYTTDNCSATADLTFDVVKLNQPWNPGAYLYDFELVITDESGNQFTYYQFYEAIVDPPYIDLYSLNLSCAGYEAAWTAAVDQAIAISNQDNCSSEIVSYSVSPPIDSWICNETNFVDLILETNGYDESMFVEVSLEGTVVNFESAGYNFSEAQGIAEVCIETSDAPSSAVNVEISQSGGTITNGVDVVSIPASQSFVFAAGSSSTECFQFEILEDDSIEQSETLNFSLAITSGPADVLLGGVVSTVVSIIDNDDSDGDGIPNIADNCPNAYNPFQEDLDNDGIGNVCDSQNDLAPLVFIDSNVFLNSNYSGVIVRDVNDQCWQISVQIDGTLETISVVCPE